jgi:hypothetical protein
MPKPSKIRILSSGVVKFVGPCVDDRLLVDVIDGGQDALREFLFGDDAYVAEHGAGELGEEAFNQVQPRAMLRSEGKFEAALRLCREPGFCLRGDVGRMIVEDNFDRGRSRIGRVEELQEFDELARAMAILDARMDLAGTRSIPAKRLSVPWRLYS